MKKKILAAALAVCLLAVIACGTLAYFQDQESVQNRFSIKPGPEPNPDDLFSVILTETGMTEIEEGVYGKVYTDLFPGMECEKDPTVTNTGVYDAFIRVHIELSNAAAWQAACAKHGIEDLSACFTGYDESLWSRYDEPVYNQETDTLSYTYYLDSALAGREYNEDGSVKVPGEQATLFTSCIIPSVFDVYDMSTLAEFNMAVTADAIQADNTADSLNDIPDALEAFSLWEALN